jgi:hypothetical protein
MPRGHNIPAQPLPLSSLQIEDHEEITPNIRIPVRTTKHIQLLICDLLRRVRKLTLGVRPVLDTGFRIGLSAMHEFSRHRPPGFGGQIEVVDFGAAGEEIRAFVLWTDDHVPSDEGAGA